MTPNKMLLFVVFLLFNGIAQEAATASMDSTLKMHSPGVISSNFPSVFSFDATAPDIPRALSKVEFSYRKNITVRHLQKSVPKIKNKIDRLFENLTKTEKMVSVFFSSFGFGKIGSVPINGYVNYQWPRGPEIYLEINSILVQAYGENYDLYVIQKDLDLTHKNIEAIFAHEYGHHIFEKLVKEPHFNLTDRFYMIFNPYNEFFADVVAYYAMDGNSLYETQHALEERYSNIFSEFKKSQKINGSESEAESDFYETRSFHSTRTYSQSALAIEDVLQNGHGHDIFVHMRAWLGHNRSKELTTEAGAKKIIHSLIEAIRIEIRNNLKNKKIEVSSGKDVEEMNLSLLKTFLKIESNHP